MKKIVVISDTHKNRKAILSVAEIMDESDFVFHLGDHYDDMNDFTALLKDKLFRVHGNCDFGTQKELIVGVEERKILATHGDLYGVKSGLERLLSRAKDLGCDTVFFGHTHQSTIIEIDGITLINPGNMSLYGGENSFAYVVISGKKITSVINCNGNKKIN